jgi:adenylate cyclase
MALEDHAFRACVAALDLHRTAVPLAEEVMRRDGVVLALRIGINSGQVIAGEISPTSYTAVGDQVGFAQRMESVAPAGGVMLSEASARLVEGVAELGDRELVRIKGAADPVPARRLLDIASRGRLVMGREAPLVGRQREIGALTQRLEGAMRGNASVVRVTGPAGIGKSRLIGDVAAAAIDLGAEVFSTFCQSHTGNVPFHAMSGLFRGVFGIDDLDVDGARERVRTRLPDAHAEDLVLLDDLLGIRAAATGLPARRSGGATSAPDTVGRDSGLGEGSRRVRDRGRALDRRSQRIHTRRLRRNGFRNGGARPHHAPPGIPGRTQPHRGSRGD